MAAVIDTFRITKNLSVLCFGFFLLFCAFQSLANLQSTINSEEGLGVVSQSIIYAALILSSLFLPKLIIRRFGCKWTIVFSIAVYCPYVAANFKPGMWTFVPTAILLGFGGAPLWCAKCTYLNVISSRYANISNEKVEVVISRFFGIFFMVFQSTQIFGNLISYYVLKPSNETIRNDNVAICGIDFCPDMNVTNANLTPPEENQRFLLIGIYLACAISAAVLVAIFLDPMDRVTKVEESISKSLYATIRQMKNGNQILLIPITIYSGIEQAFFLSDFTKAYIACSWGIYNVGYVFICYGVVNAVISFVAGRLLQFVRRLPILMTASIGNLAASLALYYWLPTATNSEIFFVLAAVWGFCDAIWQSQINALYGALFIGKEEEAFANYRLWESMGFCLAFAYSNVLCTRNKLNILLGFLAIGTLGYTAVEVKNMRKKKIQEKASFSL